MASPSTIIAHGLAVFIKGNFIFYKGFKFFPVILHALTY
jgi:hypothetical protein